LTVTPCDDQRLIEGEEVVMDIELPAPVRAYLEASDRQDPEAVALVFAADGTATDEGETYVGREAIRAWRAEEANQYTYTTKVTGVRQEGDMWVVTVHLEGDFPGGVVDLDQRFTVADDLVTSLVIT
jgi:hypothetical protein